MFRLFAYLFLLFVPSFSYACNLSPFDYGLTKASNGEEVYWALYNTHVEAVKRGVNVSYRGVGDLKVTIPKRGKSIPLRGNTNFCGITITVENNEQDVSLFCFDNEAKTIDVPKAIIDSDDYRNIPELSKGVRLLVITDGNTWAKRIGYKNFYPRSDVKLIVNGKAMNDAVMPYDNNASNPQCQIVNTDKNRKVVKNLTLVRTSSSKNKTYFLLIKNSNNVLVKNIKLITPDDSEKYADRIIWIKNSTNVTLEDVFFDGTYSQANQYGYGIEMNNVYNSKFVRVVGNAKWGIFGNNNVNVACLDNCDVNRFDIHNYGKDITIKSCVFRDFYCQYSSTYGTIRYENCKFYDAVPDLNGGSYNSYVPHQLEMKNCELFITKKEKNRLCQMGSFDQGVNPRPELSGKAWPNIIINGLRIVPSEDIKEIFVFRVSGKQTDSLIGFDNVDIQGLKIEGGANLIFCNQEIKTIKPVKFKVNGTVKQHQ